MPLGRRSPFKRMDRLRSKFSIRPKMEKPIRLFFDSLRNTFRYQRARLRLLRAKNHIKKLSRYLVCKIPVLHPNNVVQLRIQKFLSQCGYCSRRRAEELIQEGRILVNNVPAVLGQSIDEERDIVKVDQVRVQKRPQERIVLLLNKPRGIECTQPWGDKKTVYDFIPKSFARERFLYCGRLDKDSQGMLLLTNDGDFAHQITHPSANISKIYYVTLERPLAPEFLGKMLTGIYDEGEYLKAEKVFVLPDQGKHPVLEIHLKQGRKREIRRMIQQGGSFVHRLKRTQIGQLKLKNLAVGAVKVLSPEEIALLFQ